jgi:hypothetical protein
VDQGNDAGDDRPTREAGVSRRAVLRAGTLAAAVAAVATVGDPAYAAPPPGARFASRLPDIQFDIAPFLAPPVRMVERGGPIGGTLFRSGPTYTLFLTAELRRTPTRPEQAALAHALDTIEGRYPFRQDGAFLHVAYGLPYFRRLPAGLVAEHLPRLREEPSRPAVEEAVPGPTDVHPSNPDVTKPRFTVPVRISADDLLLTIRSDHRANVFDIAGWLSGSGQLGGAPLASPALDDLLTWTSARLMFVGSGLPRRIADADHLPFAEFVHPRSSMWMGFADAVANGFGPAPICTFQGNASARLTTEDGTGYFADGAVQVFSHVILDLNEWYLTNESENTPRNPDVAYLERVQYMYRTHNPPSFGYPDQFTDGGGPAFLPNVFRGAGDALAGCRFGSYKPGAQPGSHRVDQSHRILGHVSALHRTSRAPDGTPLHIRIDGPGYDALDVPDGSNQPKLHFSAIVPTADLFRRMRISQASLDLVRQFGIESGDRGVDPRITATRRQNFLIPNRRTRAFPLLELALPVATQPPRRLTGRLPE